MPMSTLGWKWTSATLISSAVALMTASVPVMADAFGPVQYDPNNDQLIVTVLYDGTNPNHHFSIRWGPCRKVVDQLHEPAHRIIEVDVLDDQGNDAATTSYTEIVKIPLAGMSCRPATVTLWTPGGASGISTSLDIPGPPTAQ